MNRRTIHLNQTFEYHGRGKYTVLSLVEDGIVNIAQEYDYHNADADTYPTMKTLILELRNYNDVHVVFTSQSAQVADRVRLAHGKTDKLSEMLSIVLEMNNIELEVAA